MSKLHPDPTEPITPTFDEVVAPEPSPMHFDLPQFIDVEREIPRIQRPAPPRPLPVRPQPRGVRAALTHWRVKGAVQKVLGMVPGGSLLHAELQRRIGGLRDFDRECDSKVEDWRLMMGHLRRAGIELRGAALLEIGTGWYPTLPLCFYLAGADHVMTFDIERKLDPMMTWRLAERLGRHLPMIAREAGCPLADVAARHDKLLGGLLDGGSLAAVTSLGVDYRAPADASATGLPSNTLDVVFSNSVLEHVLPRVIAACFAEALRVLRPGGVVLHSVNCGDHYAYTDPTIDQLNYLAYSDEEWARWNNAFLYQNRLRAVDFTRMCARAGFDIEIDTSRPHPQRLAQLATLRVDPKFAAYTREELAVTSVDFVGRKPAAPPHN